MLTVGITERKSTNYAIDPTDKRIVNRHIVKVYIERNNLQL